MAQTGENTLFYDFYFFCVYFKHLTTQKPVKSYKKPGASPERSNHKHSILPNDQNTSLRNSALTADLYTPPFLDTVNKLKHYSTSVAGDNSSSATSNGISFCTGR